MTAYEHDTASIHSKKDMTDNKHDAEVAVVPVDGTTHDAVFGDIDGDHGPNYRNVSHTYRLSFRAAS